MKKSTAVHSTLVNTYLVLPTFYMKNENHMWVNQSNWKISTIARSLFLLTCFKKFLTSSPRWCKLHKPTLLSTMRRCCAFFPKKKMLNHALLIDVAFSSFKSLMLILRSTLSLVFSSLLLVVLVVEQLELSHYHQSRLLLLPT